MVSSENSVGPDLNFSFPLFLGSGGPVHFSVSPVQSGLWILDFDWTTTGLSLDNLSILVRHYIQLLYSYD